MLLKNFSKAATWELKNIVKALSSLPLLNTEDEEKILRAAVAELERRRKKSA